MFNKYFVFACVTAFFDACRISVDVTHLNGRLECKDDLRIHIPQTVCPFCGRCFLILLVCIPVFLVCAQNGASVLQMCKIEFQIVWAILGRSWRKGTASRQAPEAGLKASLEAMKITQKEYLQG